MTLCQANVQDQLWLEYCFANKVFVWHLSVPHLRRRRYFVCHRFRNGKRFYTSYVKDCCFGCHHSYSDLRGQKDLCMSKLQNMLPISQTLHAVWLCTVTIAHVHILDSKMASHLLCCYKPFATAHHVSASLTAFADLKQLLMGAALSGPMCSAVLLQAAARLPAIWSVDNTSDAKLYSASPSSSPVTWQGKVQQVGYLFLNKQPKAFEALTPMQQARRIADIAMSIWLFAMAKHMKLEQAAADVIWDAHTQPGNASYQTTYVRAKSGCYWI